MYSTELNELSLIINDNAIEKGFWEDYLIAELNNSAKAIDNSLATKMALISCEVAEGIEALRVGDYENFKEELADIIIRTLDIAGFLDVDIASEIAYKIDFNSKRPKLHGKRF